ncbi:MAG: hypothetical protein AVO38_15510 [delta proteobacterium ML8_D]|nr:MAG: hypothetical protein AVO38_15510 [delta proteobacterium ML8_D]
MTLDFILVVSAVSVRILERLHVISLTIPLVPVGKKSVLDKNCIDLSLLFRESINKCLRVSVKILPLDAQNGP